MEFDTKHERRCRIDAGPYVKRTDEFCYESDMLDSNKRMLIGTTNRPAFRVCFAG